MAYCTKCGSPQPILSDGLCASCERIFGPAIARRRVQFDLAYSGYALFVIAWIVAIVSFPLTYILAPLFLALVGPLLLAAIAISLKYWRHWPLPLMGAMIVLIVVLIAAIESPSIELILSVLGVYGFVVFVFSGMWFGSLRRTYYPSAGSLTDQGRHSVLQLSGSDGARQAGRDSGDTGSN